MAASIELFPIAEEVVGELPNSSPDDMSTYIFFGHSSICYDRSRESAEVKKVKLPNNVIVVTFGDIGNTNDFLLQQYLDKLAHTRVFQDLLMDPITDGDAITDWLNDKVTAKGYDKTSITVSIGVDIPEFVGVPFSYIDEEGTDTLFTSGLYDLKTIKASKWKTIYEYNPKTIKFNFDSLRSNVFTPPPIFPSKARVDYMYEAFKKQPKTKPDSFSLSEWSGIFSTPAYDLMLTPDKIFEIAAKSPLKWHIFYIPSCRSLEPTTELSGAHTRSQSGHLTAATHLEQEKEKQAGKIYISKRQRDLTKTFLYIPLEGGRRRRKRKMKKTFKRKVLRKRTIRKKR